MLPMEALPLGYFRLDVDAEAGERYRYRLDGGDELPDPASRSQPEGVHGPSAIVDPAPSPGATAGSARRRSPSR